MKRIIILLAVAAMISFSCMNDFPSNPLDIINGSLSQNELKIVSASESFGFKLFHELAKAQNDSNIFISPLSVSMALGMTLNGAVGETKQAMQITLDLGNLSDQEINESFKNIIASLSQLDERAFFQLANSIWYRNNFEVEQKFIEVNQNYFNAVVRPLDFSLAASLDVINGWVKDNTNGKIEKILDKISPLEVMFLINAIYFKGIWTNEFNKEFTKDDVFHSINDTEIPMKLMGQTNDLRVLQTDDFKAVDLPYGKGLYSMSIFLPDSDISIDSFISQLGDRWDTWSRSFTKAEGTILLPKFKVEYEKSLKKVLSSMGMDIAFTAAANFERINKDGGLFISRVKHKTFVEVDEEGTEAAAATVVGIARESAGSFFVMRVDRPFVFVIWEHTTNTILFLGQIVNPSQS